MNVTDALNSRRSVRAYKSDPVSKETLLKIMTAATKAPSWADTQPWEIFVAGGEPLDRLRAGYQQRFEQGLPGQQEFPRPAQWPEALQQRMAQNAAHRQSMMGVDPNDEEVRKASMRRNYTFFGAPAVIYLCMDKTLTPWSIFDMGILAQSLMLAAEDLGVSSIPAFSLVAFPDLIRSELKIPDDLLILFGIALGYEDTNDIVNKPRSLRRSVEDVIRLVGL